MLTANRARDIFEYNPETGIFIKKIESIEVGSITEYGYMRISVDGKHYLLHRIAWLIMTGDWPTDQIDHINGNRSDNRWINLRQADNKENSRNQSLRSTNKSGVVGVNWIQKLNKWRAQITVDGKPIHLGVFSEISDAKDARKKAEKNFGFHENHGRSPK